MIKAFRLVAKPAGVTSEEFRWQWLLNHGPAVRQAVAHSPLAKATASFVTPEQIEEYGEGHQVPVPLDFDGMESLYFPTIVHLREALASRVLAELDASLDEVAP